MAPKPKAAPKPAAAPKPPGKAPPKLSPIAMRLTNRRRSR